MPWARQGNGPDWEDIAMYLRELEKHHRAVCSLMLVPDGSPAACSLRASVLMTKQGLVVPEDAAAISVSRRWPHREHRTLEGCVMSLLMAADHEAMTRFWEQEELFGPDRGA